jgi:gas vesicle protein
MADHNDHFFKGFILGGMIGAVLGILFAPKPGREMREELSDETEKLVNKLKTDIEKAKETFEEGKQKIIEKLNKEKLAETPATETNEDDEPVRETPRKRSSRK